MSVDVFHMIFLALLALLMSIFVAKQVFFTPNAILQNES
jgi:hypothetical protein